MADATPEQKTRLLKAATTASVATALLLAVAKGAAFALTGSISILASLVDSLMDVAASLLNFVAVRFSLKPADEEHRFGHGKSEALAGLAQAAFISASAGFVVAQAIDRLLHPRPLEAFAVGLAVMGLSITATLALVLFQRHVIRVTGSTAIRADALHFVSDLATNLSTIVALVVASMGFTSLDPAFAIAIAAATLYGALRIGWDTFQVLMDRELPADFKEQIRRIVLSHREVRGLHDLRTRLSGPTKLIQLHIEMDGRISLHDAHRIADEVERSIRAAFPEADVVIHQDPAGLHEPKAFT
jgi:ferrous-iron efflux pump FieF